ncbi:MAG TPA: GNAT family N-acetyltransferase [Candidatus Acidoferrum sp.]|nr:GNAT family N-acetyltransferase [Candidatus Acidoferrum sp.]
MSDQTNLVIRAATAADAPFLFPLMRALAEQEPNPNPGAFRESLVGKAFHFLLDHPERGRVWVLAVDQSLVGYIVLTLGFSFEFFGTDAFIDELYIVPEYRRRGFGRRAVEFLEAEANKIGVNAVHLEVDIGNAAASELYRRMGFADHNRFLMTKWLQLPQ